MINPNLTSTNRAFNSQQEMSQSLLISSLEDFLTQIPVKTINPASWCQYWHLQTFSMGDPIQHLSISDEKTVNTEPKLESVYLVVEG